MMIYPVINMGHMKSFGGLQSAWLKAHPNLGQTAPQAPTPDPTKIPTAGLTKEQVYKIAGATMVDTSNKLAAKMEEIYQKYKGIDTWWLAEAAAAFFVSGPLGPIYAAADLWWQGDRNREAVVALEAAAYLGVQWANAMTQTDTGWLAVYFDGIEKTDPALAQQVSFTLGKVNAEIVKINTLLYGVKSLPPQVVNQFINTALGIVKKNLIETGIFLNNLAEILANLLGKVADATAFFKKLTETAPMVAIVVVAGIAALTLKT